VEPGASSDAIACAATCDRRKGPRKLALAPPSKASPVPTTPPGGLRCPHCGAVCSANADICPVCHQLLKTQQPSVQNHYQLDVVRDTSSSSVHYSAVPDYTPGRAERSRENYPTEDASWVTESILPYQVTPDPEAFSSQRHQDQSYYSSKSDSRPSNHYYEANLCTFVSTEGSLSARPRDYISGLYTYEAESHHRQDCQDDYGDNSHAYVNATYHQDCNPCG